MNVYGTVMVRISNEEPLTVNASYHEPIPKPDHRSPAIQYTVHVQDVFELALCVCFFFFFIIYLGLAAYLEWGLSCQITAIDTLTVWYTHTDSHHPKPSGLRRRGATS